MKLAHHRSDHSTISESEGLMSRSCSDDKKFQKRNEAIGEYLMSRSGIEAYDDHLFKIRSWNIAFTALMIAGIFGINKSSNEISSSNLLSAYLLISICFWSLDAMNKSLQMNHIDNCRDIESFLRNEDESEYFGNTISLRFSRKERRHLVSIVRFMADESIWPFYILPMFAFITTVLLSSGNVEICTNFDNHCTLPLRRIILGVISLLISSLFLISYLWQRPMKNRSTGEFHWGKFIFRKEQSIRNKFLVSVNKNIGISKIEDKKKIGPFYPEYSKNRNIVFVDRYVISINEYYTRKRNDILKNGGYNIIQTVWDLENKKIILYHVNSEDIKIDVSFSSITRCNEKISIDENLMMACKFISQHLSN